MDFALIEPKPPDSSWPRYSTRLFPIYRFVPGRSPHPRRDPKGHSCGQPERRPTLLPPGQWSQSYDYLYGVDLYNYAYWWECHEVFEGLWHVAGRHTEQGNFLQALIQLAAANLKVFMGSHRAARNLQRSGLLRLQRVPESYMGIDVASLAEELRRGMICSRERAPSIRLSMPNRETGDIRTSG
jgi:predicted metal-dependent hydrolase